MGRTVPMELKLRRILCKTVLERQVKTEIISITVNSQQVSKAVKGPRNLFLANRNVPTGRVMALLTCPMDNVGQHKLEKCMTSHLAIVQHEKKIYKCTGPPISVMVELYTKPGTSIIQKAMCTIQSKRGQQLFTRVKIREEPQQRSLHTIKPITTKSDAPCTCCHRRYAT